tara:strand:- start:990 stop:2303 length:1314 start_codon:yes stop_codon:yes gene_type:complete
MIRCFYFLLVAWLIAWAATAEIITTDNLLPNGTGNSSPYQNVDNTIPSVSTNGFNVVGTVRDWGNELETTGTGSINYTGDLTDYASQQQLNNGITLNSTTIVQNCEWTGSAYQCGQHRTGQDSYTTTVKILDENGNTLAIVNQTRNNDAGYGNNAFKYEDSVSYSGTGSNQFYWEWEGVDEGSSVNLGGPNLLGAKLTMTYDSTVIPQETIEEIEDIIQEFEQWEQAFEEPEFLEEFIPLPVLMEELPMLVLEEEELIEVLETAQELEEEFEEVEILQVFGGPEIVEEPEEEDTSSEPAVAQIEEEVLEESETNETSVDEPTVKVEVSVQSIEKQISKTIKSVDQQLSATNIIAAKVIESKQPDISSYYKSYTDPRKIYEGNNYEDLRILGGQQIYSDNKMIQVAQNDPLYIYQERIRQATYKRVILEKELKILQGR